MSYLPWLLAGMLAGLILGINLGAHLERKRAPTRCRQDIFNEGVQVCVLAGVPAKVIDAYVKAAAAETGQDVDWHYVGGRAVVLAMGSPGPVYEWFRQHKMIYGD